MCQMGVVSHLIITLRSDGVVSLLINALMSEGVINLLIITLMSDGCGQSTDNYTYVRWEWSVY
jgi:hypothetical protein